MFLANMRMATKLGAGFALVTLLTLALGSISLWQMRQMDASTRAVVQHAMPSVVDVSSLRELWSRLRRAEAGILNVNSVAEVDGYVAQITRVQEEIQAHERSYESLARQPQEHQLWERYQQLRGQYAPHPLGRKALLVAPPVKLLRAAGAHHNLGGQVLARRNRPRKMPAGFQDAFNLAQAGRNGLIR